MLERFCREIWVNGGEVLRGEKTEERVAKGREELVGLLCCRGGMFRGGVGFWGGGVGGMCETC